MISWIVASHQPKVLADNLLRTLDVQPDDEMVVVTDASSITRAYATGQARATQPVHCYIHHDVEILDNSRLRADLIETTQDVGIVGVVGSRSQIMPWWNGDPIGSVLDSRVGLINFGPGGTCVVLDGLLLATRCHIDWDTEWPGWHGYDHDACAQMVALGLGNWCLTAGHELVRHNASSSTTTGALTGWAEACAYYGRKWG